MINDFTWEAGSPLSERRTRRVADKSKQQWFSVTAPRSSTNNVVDCDGPNTTMEALRSRLKEVEAENDELVEKTALLESQCSALRLQSEGAAWAAQRSVELSNTLDALQEERSRQQNKNGELRARIESFQYLEHLQEILMEHLGVDNDCTSGTTSGKTFSERLMSKLTHLVRKSEDAMKESLSLLSSGLLCTACFLVRETRMRREWEAKEENARVQLKVRSDAVTFGVRFASQQLTEMENDLMQREDFYSHQAECVRWKQRAVDTHSYHAQIAALSSSLVLWKEKHRSLKSNGKLRLCELQAQHDNQLIVFENECLRRNPQLYVLRFLMLSCVKTHHEQGKLRLLLSLLRKELLVARKAVDVLRVDFYTRLQQLGLWVERVLKQAFPACWVPVERKRGSSVQQRKRNFGSGT